MWRWRKIWIWKKKVVSNKIAKASIDNVRMFFETTEDADEILFKYLGEIEDIILKQPKYQTFLSNWIIYNYIYSFVLEFNL